MIHLVISLNSRWWYFNWSHFVNKVCQLSSSKTAQNWRGYCSGETIKTVLKTVHVDNCLKLLKFVKSEIV